VSEGPEPESARSSLPRPVESRLNQGAER
jgi:hypothetical protein